MSYRCASMTTLAVSVLTLTLLLLSGSATAASNPIADPGEGAGQVLKPEALAVNLETGDLYVADTENNRIDVFSAAGVFQKTFGWGVNKAAGNQFEVCTANCRQGLAGAGNGQFKAPRSIAVDNDPLSSFHGSVYVMDTGNGRVERFSPSGAFEDKFGSPGEGEGQFSSISRIPLAVGPGGRVYIADVVVDKGNHVLRLQRFEPSGASVGTPLILFEGEAVEALAVDSAGTVYVSSGDVFKYEALGGEPSEVIDAGSGLHALALDAADDLFVSTADVTNGDRSVIAKYDPTGKLLSRFGYGSFDAWATGIASTPGGVYATEGGGNRVLKLDFPPAGPLVFPAPCGANPLGNSEATLNAEVNPEGKATSFHFEYITNADFVANGNSFEGSKSAIATPPSALGGAADFNLHKASATVSVVPETKYHCRVVAEKAENPDGEAEGEAGKFESLPALEIVETSASEVGTEAATLNAKVNPLGIAASGFFEYVDDDAFQASGFATATKVPIGMPIDFEAGNEPRAGDAAVFGLKPGTTYHYRLLATDSLIEPEGKTIVGKAQIFRTFASGSGDLLDDRAYELVSPGQKDSAEVAVPSVVAGLFAEEKSVRIQAAAGSGEALTYTSWTSFGNPEGAPSASQYLSKRGANGWGTENISPFGFSKHLLDPPYRGFSPDLRFGAFVISEPPLTPEAQTGFDNLYLRNDGTGSLQALTIEAPQPVEGEGFCAGYAGASADGQHAFFAGKGAITGSGAPPGKGFSLYEWSKEAGLKLVSRLPNGTPAPPVKTVENVGKGTGFGAVGGNCTMDQAVVRHAVSEDGSVAFWTYGGKYENSEQPLFARIGGTETVQLDAKSKTKPGSGPAGEGHFWAATGDGAEAFFTAPGKLVSGAKNNGLYRYDTATGALDALTPKADPQIEGVIGASEDGKYVYFVGKGALTDEEENGAGEKAIEGANNLYLWHEGEGLRFIAALSLFDEGDWETAPEKLTARVSPDGRHLAFLTIEAQALSGFVNAIAPPRKGCQPDLENKLNGDPRCPEAYLYDAEAGTLTCASCNPTGSRPLGPAELPSWSNPYEGPRYLSDDGSRLYFESRDALSATDENKKRDVYEFEQEGSGSCGAQSPDFVESTDGCLALISNGRSEDESYLVDASGSGRDVFFATRSVLTGWDTNENYDLYDAREGGGFPEPPPARVACEGEACKPPPAASPVAPTPATPTFQGPANQKPKQGKHKHHKEKHPQKRASHKRGAGQ
jgi:DNA-binding beta-propeller fold protein YncE